MLMKIINFYSYRSMSSIKCIDRISVGGLTMRFILLVITVVLFNFIYPLVGQASTNPSVSANNAILMEQSSGKVLFEKKAHEKQSIASITKVMTAIIAIESEKMNETAKASRRAIYRSEEHTSELQS